MVLHTFDSPHSQRRLYPFFRTPFLPSMADVDGKIAMLGAHDGVSAQSEPAGALPPETAEPTKSSSSLKARKRTKTGCLSMSHFPCYLVYRR